MKCDELKRFEIVGKYTDEETIGECYDADEVDAAIAELKDENRKLKRTMWLARLRTLMNFSVLAYFQTIRAKGKESKMDFDEMAYRINLACVKCRAKAEEYK